MQKWISQYVLNWASGLPTLSPTGQMDYRVYLQLGEWTLLYVSGRESSLVPLGSRSDVYLFSNK